MIMTKNISPFNVKKCGTRGFSRFRGVDSASYCAVWAFSACAVSGAEDLHLAQKGA